MRLTPLPPATPLRPLPGSAEEATAKADAIARRIADLKMGKGPLLPGRDMSDPLTHNILAAPVPPQYPAGYDPLAGSEGPVYSGPQSGPVSTLTPDPPKPPPLTPDPTTAAVVDGRLPVATGGPIPGKTLDWEGEANNVANEMFAVADGDDYAAISAKIRGRQRFSQSLQDLSRSYGRPPTSQEVRAIGRAFYENMMGGPQPIAPSFSDNAQAALEAAFKLTPERRLAQIEDIPKSSLVALGARGIANMLLGRGTFGDGVRTIHQAVEAEQPALDVTYQNQVAQSEAMRQMAIERYKRITALEDDTRQRKQTLQDYDLQQAGFEARDARTAERGEAADKRRESREDSANRVKHVESLRYLLEQNLHGVDVGTRNTYADMFDAAYEALPAEEKKLVAPLPDSVRTLVGTLKERKAAADIAKIETGNKKTEAETAGQLLKNQFDSKTLDARAKTVGVNLDRARVSLDTLRVKLKGLPDQMAADLAYKHAETTAVVQRAQAALIAANRPRLKGGGTDPDVKALIAAQQGLDRDYSNSAEKLHDLVMSKEELEASLETADRRARSDDANDATKRRPAELRGRLADVDKEIATVKTAADGRAKQIAATADAILAKVKSPVQGPIGGKKLKGRPKDK